METTRRGFLGVLAGIALASQIKPSEAEPIDLSNVDIGAGQEVTIHPVDHLGTKIEVSLIAVHGPVYLSKPDPEYLQFPFRMDGMRISVYNEASTFEPSKCTVSIVIPYQQDYMDKIRDAFTNMEEMPCAFQTTPTDPFWVQGMFVIESCSVVTG